MDMIGSLLGIIDGAIEGEEGVVVGTEVGVSEGGPELHTFLPEATHAGYTQHEAAVVE